MVVNGQLEYVWKQSRKTMQAVLELRASGTNGNENSVARCLSVVLQYNGVETNVAELVSKGDAPKDILGSLLTDKEILDLSGCSVEQVLYYVNCGIPVIGFKENGQAVLIVGYDTLNAAIYEPSTGKITRVSFEDTQAMFQEGGNQFLAYI